MNTGAPPRPSEPTSKSRFAKSIGELLDRPIPPDLLTDPEVSRRARLMTRFGFLGSLFGFSYALFYLCIGHWWGAEIILTCTVGVMFSPFLVTWKHAVEPAANFFCLILTLGFLGLCFVEGGVHGHALAWLVSVPLCALILAGTGPAVKWVAAALLAAGIVVGLDLFGVRVPVTYDPRWNPLVTAAGYLGLILFMSLLGILFENGRASAFARMQEALRQLASSNEKLIGLNLEKNEFLGIAAHDLKNPLTVILGNGDLLKEMAERDTTKKLAAMMVSAAERMHQLITNLLDAHAIEEGKFASKMERHELGALIELSTGHNRTSAARKRIELHLAAADAVFVRADQQATMQILDNLISNAVKYSPFDSKVEIQLAPQENEALVRVHDQGPGISEEDQKRLFQKFSRLSAAPTGGESSTGLGLSIAKKLAEAMGGTIACESTLGAGSVFTLHLPLWSGEPAAGKRAGVLV